PEVPEPPAPPEAPPAPKPSAENPVEYRLKFTGLGSEYFRIWIVNLLFSIVTLGIYSAWAKVRREQYFHRNTLLDGSGFDYHGKATSILKGRLIAYGLLVLPLVLISHFAPKYYWLALLVALPFAPWLLVRAFVFRARNSSYRGLRFNFHGTYKNACKVFGGYLLIFALMSGVIQYAGAEMKELREDRAHAAFLIPQAADDPAEPFTTEDDDSEDSFVATNDAEDAEEMSEASLDEQTATGDEDEDEDDEQYYEDEDEEDYGEEDEADVPSRALLLLVLLALIFLPMLVIALFVPAFFRNLKLFQFNHLSFGKSRFGSQYGLGALYGEFLRALAMPLVPLLFVFLIGILAAIVIPALVGSGAGKEIAIGVGILVAILLFPLILLSYVGMLLMQPYLQARLTNLIWNNTQLEPHCFISDQTFKGLLKIVLINWLATMCTFGLYWPWARIKLAAYRVEHMVLVATESLDNFIGDNQQELHAAGEEIADAFDFDIGL
ncbi:MAG: DUF898 domain-containing protein, partial [Zoogloeaceae bacterium]|nr:DUF898 domain-containing protein [Zoogloeaceae bacterium]